MLIEANDEWHLPHRYLSLEAFAGGSTVEEEADRFAVAPPAATPTFTPSAALAGTLLGGPNLHQSGGQHPLFRGKISFLSDRSDI